MLCTSGFVDDVIFSHGRPQVGMSIDAVSATDVIASSCAG